MLEYLVPFKSELEIPYRTNKILEEKIIYIFSHPTLPERMTRVFNYTATHGSKVLVRDMACYAVAICMYYLKYPQQFGHSLENIRFNILIRMWRQVYKHRKMQAQHIDEYISTSMKTLAIENGFIDELLRTTLEKDYIMSADDMIKVRKNKGLKESNRASLKEGDKHFEYLCSLE